MNTDDWYKEDKNALRKNGCALASILMLLSENFVEAEEHTVDASLEEAGYMDLATLLHDPSSKLEEYLLQQHGQVILVVLHYPSTTSRNKNRNCTTLLEQQLNIFCFSNLVNI